MKFYRLRLYSVLWLVIWNSCSLCSLCLTWISALNKTTCSSEQMWPHDLLMASGRVVWLGGEGSSARLAPAFWLDCFLAVFSRGRCEAADDWFSRRTNGQRRLKRVQRKSKWQKHKEEHKRQLEGRRRRSNTKNTHLSYWDQNMERYDNNLCCFSSNEFTTYHGGLNTNEEDTKDTFQMSLPAAAADWPLWHVTRWKMMSTIKRSWMLVLIWVTALISNHLLLTHDQYVDVHCG